MFSSIAATDDEAAEIAGPTVGEFFYSDPEYRQRTLIGSPRTWLQRLEEWRSLGLTFCEIKPVYHTIDDLIAQLRVIAEEVMPAFR
jgi:hypothetical protein